MFTKTLATLALLLGASDAFFFRGQYSTNVYDSCIFEVERLCSGHDSFPNTLTRMVEIEPEIRLTFDKSPTLQSIMNEKQNDLTEDVIEAMMISSIKFSNIVKNSENYYDEESPEAIFDLMIVYVMDNSSEKGKIATKMSEYGMKVLKSSDEEEGVDDVKRRLASQLVEVKQFPEIRLRKVMPKGNGGQEIKSGFPSLKFGAARDVCLWKKFNDGQVTDSNCIMALNSIGEEVNSRIKRDSPDSVLMLPVRSKSTDESVETTYLIFDRETFNTLTLATMLLTLIAAIYTIYYIFFDPTEEDDDDDKASQGLFATLLLLPCSMLMWYEPLLSHFAFIPALIVVGIHCCTDVTSRDNSNEEEIEIETEKMLERGFAYVALPVQVV